jgi:hypothetical protein
MSAKSVTVKIKPYLLEIHLAHDSVLQVAVGDQAVTVVSQAQRNVMFLGSESCSHHLDDDRCALDLAK